MSERPARADHTQTWRIRSSRARRRGGHASAENSRTSSPGRSNPATDGRGCRGQRRGRPASRRSSCVRKPEQPPRPDDGQDRVPEDARMLGALVRHQDLIRTMGARRRTQERLMRLVAEGEELFGFRLRHQLGRGAFASVYLAEQCDLACRPVVLKISATEGTEHQTLARLQHTNIVPIFSVHEDQRSRPPGGLHALFRRRDPLQRPGTALGWAGAADPRAQLVEALESVGSPMLPTAVSRTAGERRSVRTVRPGAAAGGADPPGLPARAELLQGGRVDRGPTGRGTPPRPSAGDPPPGHQAVEHPAQRRGAAVPAGLQRGPGDGIRQHRRHPRRDGGLRGPRTPRRPPAPHLGTDPERRSAVGPVLVRPGPGRDGDRRAPVRTGRQLFGPHHPDRDDGRRAQQESPLLAAGPAGCPLEPGEHRP